MLDLSFKEKSTWGSLIAILVFGSHYFARVFELVASGQPVPAGDAAVLAFTTLGGLIVVEIVYHVLIAIPSLPSGPPGGDERDHLIEVKSAYIAHFILAAGVFAAISHCVLTSWATDVVTEASAEEARRLRWLTPFVTANVLMLTFVTSESVSFIAKLVYYRRGV